MNALATNGFNFAQRAGLKTYQRSRPLPSREQTGSPDRVELRSRAQAPSRSYYDAGADQTASQNFYGDPSRFESMSPSQLFDELSTLVTKKHKVLKYDPEQYLYPQVDRRSDGQLYCIYAGDTSNPLDRGEFNCEHVVPQSWFEEKKAPKGDLHHLFASVIDCNSLRSNLQYEDEGNFQGGEAMIACGITNKQGNLFKPNAGHGETARAVLYFMLRYPNKIGDRPNEYGENDIPMLLQWHKEHPPTEYELHRNQQIEKLQGNRNPLIDFPHLADKIDFRRGVGEQGH